MSAKRSRAILLLRELIATYAVERDTLAGALEVTEAMIDTYASARGTMSLDAQGRLATFVIDRVPSLGRMGRRLRAQVAAATDFQQGRTATHNAPPPRW